MVVAFVAACCIAVIPRWPAGVVRHRRKRRSSRDEVLILSELTALGLSAGLTPTAALDRAGRRVGGEVAAEVAGVLRRGRRVGLPAALAGASGQSGRLCGVIASALATGAPLQVAVGAYVASERRERRVVALAAARRLPVRLLFPLALLILPGFMVMTVGPALIAAVDRLGQ